MKFWKVINIMRHSLMERIYKHKIKRGFNRTDRLIKKNRRMSKKLGKNISNEEFDEIFRENRKRDKEIDVIFKKIDLYEKLRDRHWYKKTDLKIELEK